MENALARIFVEKRDPLVYHYCSLPAFESIIENGTFWAADLRAMNDPREVKGSFKTIASFLEGMSFGEGSVSSSLLGQTVDRFSTYNRFSRFFCSSFTYSHDDLYSWLNYGARGAGFALGVRKSVYSDFYWRDVTYSDDFFRVQLGKLWEEYVSQCAGGTEVEQASISLAIALQKAGVSNKHASWSNEREARLIFPILIKDEGKKVTFDLDLVDEELMIKKKVNFKSNASGLRPYIEIKLIVETGERSESALSQVLIGPNNSSEVEVVQAFLSANGFSDVEVERSACEFR